MKPVEWNREKNELVKTYRNVSFEDVMEAIHSDRLLDTIRHPNKRDYPHQQIYIVNIRNYAYIVPFVENEEKIFLKTVIPSRKMTRKYLKRKEKHE